MSTSTTSSSSTTPSIGIIISSQRPNRVCPQIASFVQNTLSQSPSLSPTPKTTPNLHLIDLSHFSLPLFNEPGIPSQIHSNTQYTHDHTRAWSSEILRHAAFIFVTPQYNWGYPAALKNAIDYLFHEWQGKPALVVSYGGHGGTKAAGQLRQVLQAVGMRVTETMPGLTFPDRETLKKAAVGEELDLEGEEGIWAGEREVICKAFEELLALLADGAEGA